MFPPVINIVLLYPFFHYVRIFWDDYHWLLKFKNQHFHMSQWWKIRENESKESKSGQTDSLDEMCPGTRVTLALEWAVALTSSSGHWTRTTVCLHNCYWSTHLLMIHNPCHWSIHGLPWVYRQPYSSYSFPVLSCIPSHPNKETLKRYVFLPSPSYKRT